jgi:Domain of unknown function (DUF4272)
VRRMSWIKKLFGKEPLPSLEKIVPIATIELPTDGEPQQFYGDQVMRKQWMEGIIEEQGIPVNRHLPPIESEAEVQIRSSKEIAERLIALVVVAAKGEGIDQESLDEFVAEKQASAFFSPAEAAFMADPNPSDHDRLQFSWRYESAWVMFWALQYIETPLQFPDTMCDVPLLVSTVKETDDLSAKGRHVTNNILNEADLIYRYHWAVRQASIDGKESPGGLHPGIVMERHQALNWLICYCDAEWDDVGTDT